MSSSRSPACPSPWTMHTRPLVLGVLVIVVVGGVTPHVDGGGEVSLGDGKGHVPTHVVVVYRRAGRGRGIVLAVTVEKVDIPSSLSASECLGCSWMVLIGDGGGFII